MVVWARARVREGRPFTAPASDSRDGIVSCGTEKHKYEMRVIEAPKFNGIVLNWPLLQPDRATSSALCEGSGGLGGGGL